MENGELLSSCQHLDLCVNQLNSILKWWLLWSHAHVFNGIYHHAVEPTHWMKKKRAVTTTTLGLSWTGKRTLQPEDAKAKPVDLEEFWTGKTVAWPTRPSLSLTLYFSIYLYLSFTAIVREPFHYLEPHIFQYQLEAGQLSISYSFKTTTRLNNHLKNKQTTYQPTTKRNLSLFSLSINFERLDR